MKFLSSIFVLISCLLFIVVPVNADSESTSISDAYSLSGGNTMETSVDVNLPDVPAEITNHSKGTGYRGLPNGVEHHGPGMPGYFGQATPDPKFQSLKTVLIYKKNFTVDELKKMARTRRHRSTLLVTPLVDKMDWRSRPTNITIIISRANTSAKLLGYITDTGKNEHTASINVLAEMALEAINLGANTLHVTAEGIQRVLLASGWSLGFGGTRAQLNSGEDAGSVASSGCSIGGGKAFYSGRPWLQAFALWMPEN